MVWYLCKHKDKFIFTFTFILVSFTVHLDNARKTVTRGQHGQCAIPVDN